MTTPANNELMDEEYQRLLDSAIPLDPIPQQEQRSWIRQAPRQIARTAARGVETLIGLPGELREVSKVAGDWLGDKARAVLGKEPLSEEEKQYIREELKPGDWNFIGKLVEALPTSRDVRENVTRRFTGDYLEPQNKAEAFADEVAQDFAALAIPVKGKVPFARALGSSLIANAGAEIAGEFAGEEAKNYTKLGLLFATGMIGHRKGGVKNYINELYSDMEAQVPEGARISSKSLQSKLNQIESALRKGDPGALSKQEAFKKIEAIRNKISGQEISLDEVLQLTKDTNEAIFSRPELKRAQNKLYDIRGALHDTTRQYGSENASFLEKWKEANQAYAATELSKKVGSWVKRNIKPRDYVHAAAALGLEGAFFGAPTAIGTAALVPTAYTAEIMRRIAKSPALRRYYTNTVTNSLKQNKGGFVRNIKMLNDGLEKSIQAEPLPIFEFDEEEQD